jgi:hypothetical protein
MHCTMAITEACVLGVGCSIMDWAAKDCHSLLVVATDHTISI